MPITQLVKSRLLIAWQVFGRMFVMLGLALLGWGIYDLSGFLSNPTRAAFMATVIIQALFHAWILLRVPPQPEHEHHFDFEHWHYSLAELIFILAAFGDRRDILVWGENPAIRWVGLGIYLLGSSLSTWTNLIWVNYLRRTNWQGYDNAVLLDEGPFRWIRYPNLLFLFFYGLGFALAFRSWVGLVLVLPLVWMLFRRINEWEKLYAERYKKVWALRCQESKRIIPFLY